MEKFLGIDVGGTNVKLGVVNQKGSISKNKKFLTATLAQNNGFVDNFADVISHMLTKSPKIKKVGIGLPGTLSKDRTTTLEVPAIPQLDGVNLKMALQERFNDMSFFLENDANAAALGEYYFPKDNIKLPPNFIFITMGTGIGGAAIINGKIFQGGDGNGMEVGHVFSRNSTLLENNIGKKGILNIAREYIGHNDLSYQTEKGSLTSADLILAAANNDQTALDVFDTVGQILGEALISVIRILDIKTIIIGGGVSSSFQFIVKSLEDVLNKHLTPYYTKELNIKRATQANQAGIIGAASLCF